jgi:membrane protease YdiL (CAAX protease family)/LysM repeat protein
MRIKRRWLALSSLAAAILTLGTIGWRWANSLESRASPAQTSAARSWSGLAFLREAVPGLYLLAITGAELATVVADARAGVIAHVLVLAALLVHASLVADRPEFKLLLAFSLAPLIRILSLSMPLEDIDMAYWYGMVAFPILIAALVVARTLRLNRRDLGFSLDYIPFQLLVGCTGVAFGVIEYFILDAEPLIDNFSWGAFWVPAIILLVGTGFTEEFIFRGIMQSAAGPFLGRAAILYVTALFAILHVGYSSILDVLFVFAVGLFFAWVVLRTRSILGVTISHGITNIGLYLVVPFLWFASTTTPAVQGEPPTVAAPVGIATAEATPMATATPPATVEPAPLPPTPTPTPTPVPSVEPTPLPTAPPAPEEPVAPAVPTQTHTVAAGEILFDIAMLYGTTVDELVDLNGLPDRQLIYAGQTLVVPSQGEGQIPSTPGPGQTWVHVVAVGESLGAIADLYGTSADVLMQLNGLADPNIIWPGQELIIPAAP